MAVYERMSGEHVAERIRPAPGSDDEKRLEKLVKDGADGWRRVDERESRPKPRAKKPAAGSEED